MGLITGTAHKVDVPHERSEADGGPHWVEIRKLSGSDMDEANHSATAKVLDRMGEVLNSLPSSAKPPTPTLEEQNSMAIRRAVYDPVILIKHALMSWSYHEEIGPDPGSQLDSITRDWLWELIVEENTHPPEPLPTGEQS